ncbi:hypothetical protein JCM19239_2140 [Vibrio variabilis]|uniref:HNH endonuclease n=1 Tax=Vibrio variabilis TaxID=990271 RepID=A0ABQ0JJF8_9VIBR|nr:hypothetical protein JCM19239_2140 [Vibrio variabilis]
MNNFTAIDVPFNSRHTCWFCGDMSDMSLYFPRRQDDRKAQTHLPLELPICNECNGFANVCVANSTSHLRLQIKHHLLKKYAKTLGIGVNWTKLELEEAELDGAAFKGFKKSAWSMYEIAKKRVDYKGWDICVDGIPLSNLDESSFFQFDEMRFLNVDAAIDFYSKSESLSKMLLSGLVRIVGDTRFSYALRIARINFDVSRKEEKQILSEVELQEREHKDISELERVKTKAMSVSSDLDPSIRPVTIQGATATPEAIHWAFSRGISDLIMLDKFEDAFFEEHEHLGGMVAFQLYNGLQLYLEAREDESWVESNDPNRYLWEESEDEVICFDEFINVLIDYEIRQTSDYRNLFLTGIKKDLPKDQSRVMTLLGNIYFLYRQKEDVYGRVELWQ